MSAERHTVTAAHLFSSAAGTGILGLILDAPLGTLGSRIPPPPPSDSVPHRGRQDYLTNLKKARAEVSEVSREALPELMQTLPTPRHVGDRVDLEWLAWRDAILERALALGYLVGEATERTFQNSEHEWSVEAKTAVGTRTIRYPIGGQVSGIGKIPAIGRAVLMTRGYDADTRDHRNRPYLPVSTWFLHDPVSAQ